MNSSNQMRNSSTPPSLHLSSQLNHNHNNTTNHNTNNNSQHQSSLNELAQIVLNLSETQSELIATFKNEVQKAFNQIVTSNLSLIVRNGLHDLLDAYRSNSEKQIQQITNDLDRLETLVPFHVTRTNRVETDRVFGTSRNNYNNNNNSNRVGSYHQRSSRTRYGLYSPPHHQYHRSSLSSSHQHQQPQQYQKIQQSQLIDESNQLNHPDSTNSNENKNITHYDIKPSSSRSIPPTHQSSIKLTSKFSSSHSNTSDEADLVRMITSTMSTNNMANLKNTIHDANLSSNQPDPPKDINNNSNTNNNNNNNNKLNSTLMNESIESWTTYYSNNNNTSNNKEKTRQDRDKSQQQKRQQKPSSSRNQDETHPFAKLLNNNNNDNNNNDINSNNKDHNNMGGDENSKHIEEAERLRIKPLFVDTTRDDTTPNSLSRSSSSHPPSQTKQSPTNEFNKVENAHHVMAGGDDPLRSSMSICSQSTLKKVLSVSTTGAAKESMSYGDGGGGEVYGGGYETSTIVQGVVASSAPGAMMTTTATSSMIVGLASKSVQENIAENNLKNNNNNNNNNNNSNNNIVNSQKTSPNSHSPNKTSSKASTSGDQSSQRNTNSNAAVVCAPLVSSIKYMPPTSGYEFRCYISHADNPFLFWIQVNDIAKELKRLQSKMNKFYSNKEKPEANRKITHLDKSQVYAAKYPRDKKWYRIKVLDYNERDKNVDAFYLDYGNKEPLSIRKIRPLDASFQSDEMYAIPVSLANAFPVGERWSEEAIADFQNLTIGRFANFKCRREADWPIPFCSITVFVNDEQVDALSYLISRGVAVEEKDYNVVQTFKEDMSVLDNYYKFRHLDSMTSSQQATLSNNLQDGANLYEEQPIYIDSCGENGSRSRERSSSKRSRRGELVDLNNSSQDPNTSMISSVQKFKLVSIDDLPKKSLQLDEDCRLRFELAAIVHPYEFYVHANIDDHAAYAQLALQLNAYYSTRERRLRAYSEMVQYSFVNEGAVCVCKSERNGQFYRAQIKFFKQSERSQSKAYGDKRSTHRIVTYIDHGNLDNTSIRNVFPLAAEFATLAPYCIACRLDLIEPVNDYVQGIWSDAAVEFFKSELNACRSSIHATLFHNQEPFSFIRTHFDDALPLIIYSHRNDLPNENDQVAPPELTTINELLVSKGFARLTMPNGEQCESANQSLGDEFESASNTDLNLNALAACRAGASGAVGVGSKKDSDESDYLLNIPLDTTHQKKHRLQKWVNSCEPATSETERVGGGAVLVGLVGSSNTPPAQQSENNSTSLHDLSRIIRSSCSGTKLKTHQNEANSMDVVVASAARVPKDKAENSRAVVAAARVQEEKTRENVVPTKKNMRSHENPSSKSSPELSKTLSENNNNTIISSDLDAWNPIENEFNSIKNIYGLDENKPEARLYGYMTKVEGEVCREFVRFKSCRRKNCPFLHQHPSEKKIVSNSISTQTHLCAFVELDVNLKQEVLLFKSISVNINSSISGCVQGYTSKELDIIDAATNELEILCKEMNEYYSSKKFLREKTTLYKMDQLVAAKINNRWLRGRIIEIYEGLSIDFNHYLIRFVDYGFSELLTIKEIYPIHERFLHNPLMEQIINVHGFSIDSNRMREVNREVSKLNRTMQLYVAFIDVEHARCFSLFGINRDSKHCIDIGQYLIKSFC